MNLSGVAREGGGREVSESDAGSDKKWYDGTETVD